MKILVTIASFGTYNDQYLERVIREYRSMPYDVHIVLLTNVAKNLGQDESVIVDLRGKDPHTLPFAHKRVMADCVEDFDLFIYSEDDTLIRENNLAAFLEISALLPADELPGFLNTDIAPNGERHFCNMSKSSRWQPGFLVERGGHQFAFFTNEHSAAYVLTQDQLRRAIRSGGFVVEPHEGRYNWACSAATDPYTQCGFKKLICISRFEDFLLHHLPSKYAGRPYGGWCEMKRQIDALVAAQHNGSFRGALFEPETKILHLRWSKDYYEDVDQPLVALVPEKACTILSIGCAWGATEGHLVSKRLRVVGVPMDSVIAASAAAKGIEIVCGDMAGARAKLEGRRFDCILMSDVLHLVPDPVGVLKTFTSLLSAGGTILATAPNLGSMRTSLARLRGKPYYDKLGNFDKTGLQRTSSGALRKWFTESGLRTDRVVRVLSEGNGRVNSWTMGLAGQLLADKLVAVGRSQ